MDSPRSSRVRILHTIRQGKIGGGESHVLDLIQNLDKTRFESIVLSFTDGPMVTTLRSWGVETHVIYTERAFNFRVWGKVRDLFKRERIDIVHAHGTRAHSNVFWAARKLKLPLIYTVHGWSFHQDQNFVIKTLREAGERFLTRRCHLTICVSNSNQRDGQERLKLKSSIVINYGINLEKFNPYEIPKTLKSELGVAPHQTLVGYLARITIQKDPHTFIRAIAHVVKETKDVKFLVVGDGDLKESTLALAKELNVGDQIIFQNFRQDIPFVLSGIDIYCLPSLWEGLPIGLLEAMAMKKAIVATPVDGTKEAIQNGTSGILVPHQSPQELANAILLLHRQKDKLQQFGNEARKTIEEHFEVTRMAREVEQAYARFLPRLGSQRKLRIGIEAQRLFREKKHGLEIVALEVIRYLQKIDTFNEYVIFVRTDVDRNCISETKNFKIREVKARSFPEWEQIVLPRAVKEERIDLLHCTANTAPLFTPVPIVLTLHDIIFTERTELRGNYYQNFGNLYRRILLPLLARKVKRIITVSNSEKTRIVGHLNLPPEKVEVIYNAVDESFRKLDRAATDPIRRKYNLPEKFILFFGNSAQKKNSLGTIHGYLRYCKQFPDAIPLVVAGAFEKQIQEELHHIELEPVFRKKVMTIGYIPFDEQPAMYNLAHLFLYTSKRESFGMPILESMACGTPVITSDTSSMPEIAGNAAHLVNPFIPGSIADGIHLVLSDPRRYDNLVQAGFVRVTNFSWKKAAEALSRLYGNLTVHQKGSNNSE